MNARFALAVLVLLATVAAAQDGGERVEFAAAAHVAAGRARDLEADPDAVRAVRVLLRAARGDDGVGRRNALRELSRLAFLSRPCPELPAADTLATEIENSPMFLGEMSFGPVLRAVRDELVRALDDPEPEIRLAGADGLWAFGGTSGPEAEARLVERLDDPHPGVRNEACSAFGAIGAGSPAALDRILGRMAREPSEYLHHAIPALRALDPEGKRSVPALTKALDCRIPYPAEMAVNSLADLGPAAAPAVPKLVGMLDRRGRLRMELIHALGAIGPDAREALPALLARRERGPWRERAAAAFSAWRVDGDGEAALAILRRALNTDHGRAEALHALSNMGDAARPLLPEIERYLEGGGRRSRQCALVALRRLHPDRETVLAAHVAALYSEDAYVVTTAAHGLAILHPPPEARAPLTRALGHSLVYCNLWALRALGAMGPAAAESADVLRAELRSRSWNTRKEAIRALDRIGPAGHAALLAAWDDPRPWVRGELIGALSGLDAATPGLRITIAEALRDPSHYVRLEAAVTLSRVDGPSAASIEAVLGEFDPRDLMRSDQAAAALARLGPEAVRDWLVVLGRHPAGFQQTVLISLGRIPRDVAAPLLPRLAALREDPDPALSTMAARTERVLLGIR